MKHTDYATKLNAPKAILSLQAEADSSASKKMMP